MASGIVAKFRTNGKRASRRTLLNKSAWGVGAISSSDWIGQWSAIETRPKGYSDRLAGNTRRGSM